MYNNLKLSQIRLSSEPRNSKMFYWPNLNLAVAHVKYMFCHCRKYQNPMTEASYESAADKVFFKHPQISQNRLSSDPVISTILVDETETSTLHICNIYYFTVWSFKTLGRLHIKAPRIKWCMISVTDRRTDRRTDGRTDGRTDKRYRIWNALGHQKLKGLHFKLNKWIMND